MCSHRERARKRYAEDAAYRRKRLAYAHAYHQANKEEISERDRRRWQTDPAYRQRRLAQSRAYWQAHKEELSERRRRERLANRVPAKKRLPPDPAEERKKRLKRVYGISPEEYDAILAHQGGVCAICKKKPDTWFCVDHCHVTGEVRGLLCHGCNSALGFFREDSSFLSAAIAYLQAARERPWHPALSGPRRARL